MTTTRGTMREKKSGTWELRAFVGRDPVTGSPRQVSRTFHGGKRAAQSALAELVAEVGGGHFDGTSATVETLLDRYLDHLDRKGLSPGTVHAYRCYVRVYVSPAIGSIPIRKLTAWNLDELYAAMSDAGKSPSTVRQVHAILSGALGQAVKWGWSPVNVARMATPPTVRAAKIVPPTAEQVRSLVAAAEDRDPILAVLLMLAALTGARRGELCALRWSDVDLATGQVHIARSLLDLPGRVEEKATKTHQERVLALGSAGVALLTLHRESVALRATQGEVEVQPDGFVFSPRLDGGSPYRPYAVTGFFTRVRNELGLGHLHLHSLRHFLATQLAARGDVSIRTLAGRLGHADASITLKVYSHFMPAADLQAAGHVGRALAL